MKERYYKWNDVIQKYIEKNPSLKDHLLKYQNLKIALKDALKYGLDQEKIKKVKELGIQRGDLTLEDFEIAQSILKKVRAIHKAKKSQAGLDLAYIVDNYLGPEDVDLKATALFCDPEVKELVGNRLETLYRAELINYSKGIPKAKRQLFYSQRDYDFKKIDSLLGGIEKVIEAMPREEFSGDKEYQRRLRQIIQKKAERDTFKFFRENPKKAFRFIDTYLEKQKNENIKDVYKKLKETYKGYTQFQLKDVNPNFIDPQTGKGGVLPLLHQRIGVYHIIKEEKFGLFDDCGTGKTAIAVLAQPLIEEELRKQGKNIYGRTVIVCPYPAIEAWEKGLTGNEKERYLKEKQDILIINNFTKFKEDFEKKLKTKKWIIVNYEQLPTKVKTDGEEKLLTELLNDVGFDYLIFDEVHNIKNKKLITKGGTTREPQLTYSAAARYLALNKNRRYLALLSGTPIPDSMDDYAMIYFFLNSEKCIDPNKDLNDPTNKLGPANFEKLYEKNPRILSTFTSEKTLRRKSEDITDLSEPDEQYVNIDIDDTQRKIHDYIIASRPGNWGIERMKALLDPRLVDPKILQRLELLGKVSIKNSAKYRILEEILTDEEGPIANGEKTVIFSTFFKRGVTREHKKLRNRYIELGLGKYYEKLGLKETLQSKLEKILVDKFGNNHKIEILDGEINPRKRKGGKSKREEICDRFKSDNNIKALLCTTATGGESLNFSHASWAIYLDEDYSPKTMDQANSRLLRIGQANCVKIRYLRGKDTLDELLTDYVEKKRLIIKMALDGYPLTQEEEGLFKDLAHKRFDEMIKRSIGGLPVDLSKAKITIPEDFDTGIYIHKNRERIKIFKSINYETTNAQRIREWIWKDPINCWFNQEFVELYNKTLNNLAVYTIHRAKICDLINRTKRKEVVFPGTILSEGSGPSLLYRAYQDLKKVLKTNRLNIPFIVDRDFSELMLREGSNPNKILGNMTGEDSAIKKESFDMVDNESITLLKNDSEVKDCLVEANRVLKPQGLLEIMIKNWKFKDAFYPGLEKLGFKILSKKNEGLKINRNFFKYLKNEHGEHFAEAYAQKLANTYLILVQKQAKPDLTMTSNSFWFDPINAANSLDNGNGLVKRETPTIVKELIKPKSKEKPAEENFTPYAEIKVDKWGHLVSYKRLNSKNTPEVKF